MLPEGLWYNNNNNSLNLHKRGVCHTHGGLNLKPTWEDLRGHCRCCLLRCRGPLSTSGPAPRALAPLHSSCPHLRPQMISEQSNVTDGVGSRALKPNTYFARFQPSLPPRNSNPLFIVIAMRVTYEGDARHGRVAIKKEFAEPLRTTWSKFRSLH